MMNMAGFGKLAKSYTCLFLSMFFVFNRMFQILRLIDPLGLLGLIASATLKGLLKPKPVHCIGDPYAKPDPCSLKIIIALLHW